MRRIRVEAPDWSEVEGARAAIPVLVDWPELRLTADQRLANVVADLDGERRPYPDNTRFVIEIERPR